MILYTNNSFKPKRRSKKVIEKRGRYKPEFKELKVSSVEKCNTIPSLNSNEFNTSKIESIKYTGDKLLGISALHKSNLVPVFSSSEAEEIAKMRR